MLGGRAAGVRRRKADNPAVAAALNGISVNRYIIGAFMTSSTLTGFTGVIIAAEQFQFGPVVGALDGDAE